MKTRTLLTKLGKLFPKHLAKKNHDFVGLMVGKLPEEVFKIVICLDFDEQIEKQVISYKPDLIITHHPFIFGKKSKVLKYDSKKELLYSRLEKANIPLISIHTNFDEGKRGMNDALARVLELENVFAPEEFSMMRIGTLKDSMSIEDFCLFAKRKLNVPYGLLIDNGPKMIKKVGIVGGGGSRYYDVSLLHQCDIYISGDAPHHVRRGIVRDKANYLDVPHEVENIFMPTLKDILLSFDSNLEIVTITHEEMPKVI